MTGANPPAPSNLLSGNVRGTVFRLAIPVLLEQFLIFCVGFYDTYLAGGISSDATSAIGLAAYVGWLASMMYSLVGTGTTALVARHWGAGERDEANRIASCSMLLATVTGVGMCVLIFFSAPLISRSLNMGGEAHLIIVRYLRIDGFGHLLTGITLIGAAALRGSGNMVTPMIVLATVCVVNVLASATMVYGIGPIPEIGLNATLIRPMGIDGIVFGTIIARFVGGILMIIVLLRGRSGIKLLRKQLSIRGERARRILRIGIPAAIDGGVTWIGQFFFLMVIARLATEGQDSSAFAAHIIGIRIEAITYLPAVAWGVAASTLIGQSLGANLPKRAIRAGHEATLQCCLLASVITIVFFFGASWIYNLMHNDAQVVQTGIAPFRLLAFFQVPLAILIVYEFGLRGAGQTRFPMLVNTLGVLLIRCPIAYVCGIVLHGGLFGAWIGMCADMAIRALVLSIYYLKGKWVETKV